MSDMKEIRISAHGRGNGKTTALIDIAIANARRGEVVHYWSSTEGGATAAYERGRAQVPTAEPVVVFVPGEREIRFKRGLIRFCSSENITRGAGIVVTDHDDTDTARVLRP